MRLAARRVDSPNFPKKRSSALAPRRQSAQSRAQPQTRGRRARSWPAIFSSAPDMDPRLRAPALKGDVEALTTALRPARTPISARRGRVRASTVRRFKWACASALMY